MRVVRNPEIQASLCCGPRGAHAAWTLLPPNHHVDLAIHPGLFAAGGEEGVERVAAAQRSEEGAIGQARRLARLKGEVEEHLRYCVDAFCGCVFVVQNCFDLLMSLGVGWLSGSCQPRRAPSACPVCPPPPSREWGSSARDTFRRAPSASPRWLRRRAEAASRRGPCRPRTPSPA